MPLYQEVGILVVYIIAAITIAYLLFEVYKKIWKPIIIRKVSYFPVFTLIYLLLGSVTGHLIESLGIWGGLWALPFFILAVFLMMLFDPEFY